VHAGEDRVGTLAVEGQGVFEHHLDVAESRVVQRSGEEGDAAFP
jgi:hypothetical protein